MVSIFTFTFTFTFTSHSHGINIRHIPYDTADRKLTSKIVTNAVRPRPSQGECPVTSGQDTSAREDSAPRATQDSSNGTPTNSLFKKNDPYLFIMSLVTQLVVLEHTF